MIHTKSILVAILLFSTMSFLSAQSTPKFQIELKKLEIRNDVDSPRYPDQIDKGSQQQAKEWTVLFARYIIKFDKTAKPAPGALDNGMWLNTLSVDWKFLYKPEKAANLAQNYIKFGEEVKYANLEDGEHTALIFIDPKILKRYFDEGKNIKKDLHIKVSFKADGLRQKLKIGNNLYDAAFMSEGKLVKKVPESMVQAFENDRIKTLPNVVRPRNKTPFSVIQFDQFDTIAVDEKN